MHHVRGVAVQSDGRQDCQLRSVLPYSALLYCTALLAGLAGILVIGTAMTAAIRPDYRRQRAMQGKLQAEPNSPTCQA